MKEINKALFWNMILISCVFAFGPSFSAHADMGRIYVSNAPVTVSEDAQKAIILHNLDEEILILGTDIRASRKTGIIRFIPFPSEPVVELAPAGAFEKAAAMIKKYELRYQQYHYTKGGAPKVATQGVELRLNKKLGAHDLTMIKVNDPSTFRRWVNHFFKSKGLPAKDKYPEEEAIVADYVKRGIVYFVLDYVEIADETRFIEPVAYRFKCKQLYYPLITSNTFGGQGSIELMIITPATLCAPGNEPLDPYSGALYDEKHPEAQRPYGQRPLCLNLPVKASTSARLVKEEKDLDAIYPSGEDFFKGMNTYLQMVSYTGKYYFKDDIFADVSTGKRRAFGPMTEEEQNPHWDDLIISVTGKKECSEKPRRGPCKGSMERYYYDAESKTCKTFLWGGCGGNVPFETENDCKQSCSERMAVP